MINPWLNLWKGVRAALIAAGIVFLEDLATVVQTVFGDAIWLKVILALIAMVVAILVNQRVVRAK